jgi:hypothetical protein
MDRIVTQIHLGKRRAFALTYLHELHADIVPRAAAAAVFGRFSFNKLREILDSVGEDLQHGNASIPNASAVIDFKRKGAPGTQRFDAIPLGRLPGRL